MTWLYFVLVQSVFVFVGSTLTMDQLNTFMDARFLPEELRGRDPVQVESSSPIA
jgi:hypothetical protein